jgi:hypothetical protein
MSAAWSAHIPSECARATNRPAESASSSLQICGCSRFSRAPVADRQSPVEPRIRAEAAPICPVCAHLTSLAVLPSVVCALQFTIPLSYVRALYSLDLVLLLYLLSYRFVPCVFVASYFFPLPSFCLSLLFSLPLLLRRRSSVQCTVRHLCSFTSRAAHLAPNIPTRLSFQTSMSKASLITYQRECFWLGDYCSRSRCVV